MQYLSFRPGPPLNEFVDHFWLIGGGQAPRLEKILPSATNELVVNLKNNEIHIHEVDSKVSGTRLEEVSTDWVQL